MPRQLRKMMYEFERPGQLFGLSHDQVRCPRLVTNAGWFNSAGEKIGYGDLSADDIRRISSEEINWGELFIVLEEDDHRSNLPKDLKHDAPGIDYVLSKAHMVLARETRFLILRDRPGPARTRQILREIGFDDLVQEHAMVIVRDFIDLHAGRLT